MQCALRSKLSGCGLKHVNLGSDVNGFRFYFRLFSWISNMSSSYGDFFTSIAESLPVVQ